MTLGEKRKLFTYFLCKLIQKINGTDDYSCYLGDGKCTIGHTEKSNHYRGLAQDINLFYKGKYMRKTEAHNQFGAFWKSLHPQLTWGGDFRHPDGNHYSLGEGKRL